MIKFCGLFVLFFYFKITFTQEINTLQQHYVVEDTSKYTYQMILDDINYLKNNFPNWVHYEKFGRSEFGLDIPFIRVGHQEKKTKSVLLVGNIHAREDFSSKFLMKYLNVILLSLADLDSMYPSIKSNLDSIDLYFIPVANPDGLKIAHLDFDGIKESFELYKDCMSLIETYEEWKANGIGIDLNSCFDDGLHLIKRPSNYQENYASEGFKGCVPAEAIEIQFLQQVVSNLKPLMTLSFHTKGNIIFWADDRTHSKFKGIDTKINDEVILFSCFEKASVSSNPIVYACGFENYIRAKHNLLASCVELSKGDSFRKQHPDNKFNEYVWNIAWEIPDVYIKLVIQYSKELKNFSEFD